MGPSERVKDGPFDSMLDHRIDRLADLGTAGLTLGGVFGNGWLSLTLPGFFFFGKSDRCRRYPC
jgi:hypothetical protein